MPGMDNETKRRRRKSGQEADAGKRSAALLRLPLHEICTGSASGRNPGESVAPLAASIARHGLLQPVVVRRISHEGGYRLVLGERRLAACRLLGMKNIDALLLDVDEEEGAACLLEEDEVRRSLPVCACAELIERTGMQALEACYALNSRKLKRIHAICNLSQETKRLIQTAGLTLEQSEPLLQIRDERRQLEAASIIAGRDLTPSQAQRLVCGPRRADQAADSLRGRRRAMRAAMEEISCIAKQLQRQGIDAGVSVFSQDGGMCIQLKFSKI